MRFMSFLLLISITFGGEICLKLHSSGEDPYIAHRAYHHIKNLFLESGFTLSCERNAKKVNVDVSYTDVPISVSSRQRVSSYNLFLKVLINDREFVSSVPYFVNASLGEIQRRKAVDEAFSRIKLNILEYLLELKKHAGDRGD